MKTLFPYTCTILALFISMNIQAQDITGNDAQENLFTIGAIDPSVGVVRKFDNRYEGVKGSPFYFDKWSKGSMELENGKHIEGLQLKYNAFEDELLLNKPKQGSFYLQKNNIKSFTLADAGSGKRVKFLKLKHPKKDSEFQFYRLIFDGEISLIGHLKVVFEKANYEGGYSNDKRYDEFKKYPLIYYFNPSDLQPKKVKATPAGVSRIVPNHNNEIKKYISDHNYDCRSEEDLIQILKYYQQIQ